MTGMFEPQYFSVVAPTKVLVEPIFDTGGMVVNIAAFKSETNTWSDAIAEATAVSTAQGGTPLYYPPGSAADAPKITGLVTNALALVPAATGVKATDTANLQDAINAANVIVLADTSTQAYLIDATLTFSADLTIYMMGQTIKRDASLSAAAMLSQSSAGLAFNIYGPGTIDDNSVNSGHVCFEVGFSSNYVTSCAAEDISFINVYHGAWTANAVSSSGTNYNTHVCWRNLRCTKISGGDTGDMFELVGLDVRAWVSGDDGGTSSFVLTSAWAKDAYFNSWATGSGSRNNLLLQAYTSNGSQPNFDNVVMEGNGQLQCANGDFATLTNVATSVEIVAHDAENIAVGNSAYDEWGDVTIRGVFRPKASGKLSLGFAKSVTCDVTVDGTDAGTPGLHSLVTANAAAGSVTRVTFKNLVVSNVASGAYANILGVGPSNAFQSLTVLAGDVLNNNTAAMFASADLPSFGTFYLNNVVGYVLKASAYASAGTSIPTGSPTKVTLGATAFADGNFDTSTSRYTCALPGIYRVAGRVDLSGTARTFASVYVNGSELIRGMDCSASSSVVPGSLLTLNNGDYVELWVYQGSGSSETTSTGRDLTFLDIEYAGTPAGGLA